MIYDYLTAVFEPVKYWILAYDAAGGGELRTKLCRLLGAEESEDDWEKLCQSEERLAHIGAECMEFNFARVCAALSLNPFERFALSLAMACEMDGRYRAAVRLLGFPAPTLDLALKIFSKNPEESYFLRRTWIEREKRTGLLFAEIEDPEISPLSLRESVLKFLLGLDFGIEGLDVHYPGMEVCANLSGLEVYKEIICQGFVKGCVTVLSGPKGVGKKHQLRLLSEAEEVPVLFAKKSVASDKAVLAALVLLEGYLCVCDVEEGDDIDAILKRIAPYTHCIFITTELSVLNLPDDYIKTEFYLPPPPSALRREIWGRLIRETGYETDVSAVSSKYSFTIGQIKLALKSALLCMRRIGGDVLTPEMLESGCRDRFPHNVSSLVKTVPSVFTWNELVLPAPQKRTLIDACNRVRLESLVYEDWGFGRRLPYGRGLRLLFAGPPGTGKTMAAQVMANELKMELFKVDLSTLMSKYIGETEKNLASVFDGARRSGGILFFDEADALFGKRGEQKDSHDRHANMQTAYLLQAVEDYEGVLILATNLVQNFDTAFTRRIHTRVDFTIPSREDRLKIWSGILDGGMLLEDDIDRNFLAGSFELTGAEIMNIVLTASFHAAAREKGVGMKELISALLAEYTKSGKIISKEELGEYAV